MREYIKQWNELIVNCSYDNTYKMAWAKALVELSIENKQNTKEVIISFNEIAKKCLKYYWNQTIYFDLIQGSNLKKKPEILSLSKALIEEYYSKKKDKIPERFEKAENKIEDKLLENKYLKIANVLKKDVCWRFMNLNGGQYEIYKLDNKRDNVIISLENLELLKSYSDLLFQVINYRWSQMLENFNTAPKISLKVRSTGENKEIRRDNLSKFHKYLDLEFNDNKYCFFCGEEIKKEELSVDHVIPWSFMFSDDIWNLVYCHRSENSIKSNNIVSEDIIKRLEDRNINLLKKLKELGKKDKKIDELQLAIEHNYVRKFWISSKG